MREDTTQAETIKESTEKQSRNQLKNNRKYREHTKKAIAKVKQEVEGLTKPGFL